MLCKCQYFKYDDTGKLVCDACGKPAKSVEVIEDKNTSIPENKTEIKPIKRRK